MNISMLRVVALFFLLVLQSAAFAADITGTGSMIPGPLIKVWAEAYSVHSPTSAIKYKGTNPVDGIKSLLSKEADFSSIDMPLNISDLKKNGLMQFPIALGMIIPLVNLPNIYTGQLKLDAKTLGDIFLGKIKRWNDPAITELNPTLHLPDADIVVVHRASPAGVITVIGDYLARTHPEWKSIKGDGMAGSWPATSIEVQTTRENLETIEKTQFSIGYGPVNLAVKRGLTYVQLKNKAGNFVSPSDINVTAAAMSAKWDESNGFDVNLNDQSGASSWPLTMTSFVLVRKASEQSDRTKEILKYIKYCIRNGGLTAVQNEYTPLPDYVSTLVRASLDSKINGKEM